MPSVTALPPSPYAAYLRVYEPLEAFRPEERAAWRRYAEERAVTRSARLAAEHREARRALLGLPPRAVPADESDDAYVLEVEEELLVCPVQSRLRAWLALGAFREGLPDSLLRAFVPPMALRQAYAEHEVWGAKESQPLRIRTVTCMVPMHWFVAFCGRDRRLGTDPAEPSLVYRARMSAARRRVGRALRTLRRTLGEVDYVAELEELGQWLEEFHPRAWVELDYGGLAGLMGADRLRADTSAKDVTAALSALAAGDAQTASRWYDVLMERWAEVRSLERVN